MIKVQKSKLIKIIRDRPSLDRQTDDRQMKLRSNTHGCELINERMFLSLKKKTAII